MARSRRVTKGAAFVYSLLAIICIYLVSSLYLRLPSESAALTAIVALASMFIAGNVADNGVKGKFYKDELKEK